MIAFSIDSYFCFILYSFFCARKLKIESLQTFGNMLMVFSTTTLKGLKLKIESLQTFGNMLLVFSTTTLKGLSQPHLFIFTCEDFAITFHSESIETTRNHCETTQVNECLYIWCNTAARFHPIFSVKYKSQV